MPLMNTEPASSPFANFSASTESVVHALAPSPKVVSFASAMALSTSGTRNSDATGPNSSYQDLTRQAQLATWASPAARDHKSEQAADEFQKDRMSQARGKPLSWQCAMTAKAKSKSGGLNPEFSLWLQGYPVAWLFAAPLRRARKNTNTHASGRSGPSATASSRKSRRHGAEQ